MKKTYVLDTNVLLQDPHAIFAFQDNEVVIPAVVLEEIDSKKRNQDEIGRNARYVSRLMDSFRKQGQLHSGVKTDQGGSVRVELNHRSFQRLKDTFGEMTNDNRILAVALNLHLEKMEKNGSSDVILVSKDALVRVKADALGIRAEDYLSDHVVDDHDLYKGYVELKTHPALIDQFYLNRELGVRDVFTGKHGLYAHQFVILKDRFGSPKSALCRVDEKKEKMVPLRQEQSVWGIMPRNAQQKMALDLLLNDRISLVTMTGQAGTGKTLLSLAVGLYKTEDERRYHKILVARPIVPVGKDIGYLPGEKEEKLRPWLQPIYDNLEYLFNAKRPGAIDDILSGLKSIQVEALTYIRGRSMPGQFIIIDEAQNLTRHEVKTIVSRVGEGSKIVLMGDTDQIDHPYLDSTNNGLSYVIEKFKHETISGHIKLEKGERSLLAKLAAELL